MTKAQLLHLLYGYCSDGDPVRVRLPNGKLVDVVNVEVVRSLSDIKIAFVLVVAE